MMSLVFFGLLQFSVFAYAMLGGVFLAFSDFIMRSLSHSSGTSGIETMQIINREVFRWVFMALFLGMAAISVIIIGYSVFYLVDAFSWLILLSASTYLIGCFAITVVFNVPMNEALAGMELKEGATRAYWQETYLPRWTFWNTVRAVSCVAAAGMMLLGGLWVVEP